MNQKNKLTEGPILASLVKLSVPIIITNLLQTAYQLTDTFWVGRLGPTAVASVSVSFPVIFLFVSIGGGLAIAGTIFVAQYKGRRDLSAVNHIVGQTFLSVTGLAVIIALAGYFSAPYLIKLMGTEPRVFTSATSYLRITFVGMIFMFSYMVFQSLMRGVGDVKTPMYIVLGTVLLNLVLDPLFIFGYGPVPASGVSGAALATVGTQALASLTGFFILIRGKHELKLVPEELRPDWSLIKKMFKLGFPASIEQSTRALGITALTFLVASFGTVALAAYGIGTRILSFVIIPALGLSMATSTLVGQNIGAGKIERAEKIGKLSLWTGFIVLTIVGIIFFLTARQLAAFFVPGAGETIRESSIFIRLMSLSFGFIGVQMALNGLFRGSGNTKISMLLSVISLWILRFPLAYILSKHTHLAETGIWIAFPLSNILAAVIAYIWFHQGSWKRKRITEEIKIIKKTTEETIIEEGLD